MFRRETARKTSQSPACERLHASERAGDAGIGPRFPDNSPRQGACLAARSDPLARPQRDVAQHPP